MVVKVLVKTGAVVRARVMMYRAVFQMVLIYGSESWVVTDVMLKVLEGFHHRVARCIEGMSAW